MRFTATTSRASIYLLHVSSQQTRYRPSFLNVRDFPFTKLAISLAADRLPTVSAAKALEEFDGAKKLQFIPTGLGALDTALSADEGLGLGLGEPRGGGGDGGIQKGQVTEIWGPPGVGKTAFG